MTRAEIRTFIRDGVNSVAPVLEFGAGLITDFNSIRSHQYPGTWLVQEEVTSDETLSAPVDTWPIKLVIAKKDALDSAPDQYEVMVDECDEIAQKLIYKYRNVISGYKLITMTSATRTKFVKKYADCITGVELSFEIQAPDQTNVC